MVIAGVFSSYAGLVHLSFGLEISMLFHDQIRITPLGAICESAETITVTVCAYIIICTVGSPSFDKLSAGSLLLWRYLRDSASASQTTTVGRQRRKPFRLKELVAGVLCDKCCLLHGD